MNPVRQTQRRSRKSGRARSVATIPLLILMSACQPSGPYESDNFMVESREIEIPATLVIPDEGDLVPLVVMAHGHGGSREEAGGFTRVAEALAMAGIASIRMDFAGCGDSDEPFTENYIGTMLADIRASRRAAVEHPRIDPDRVAILGYSMGGRLAILSSEDQSYDGIALWNPVALNGPDNMVAFLGGDEAYAQLRDTARSEGAADFVTPWGDEQSLSVEWFDQMERSKPLDTIGAFRGDLFLLHGERDEVIDSSVSNAVRQRAIGAASVNLLTIAGADHGLGFYSEDEQVAAIVVSQTVAFFRSVWE